MNILGIQKNHNSSACLFVDNTLVYYNEEERLSRIKKDTGFPFFCVQEIQKICSKLDILIITGYDNVLSEDHMLVRLILKMGFELNRGFKLVTKNKSHHLSHAAKAFYNSGFEDALVIVMDGRGSNFNLTNGYQAHETSTAFLAKYPNMFHAIYKRFYTTSKITEDTNIVWDNSFAVSKEDWPRWHLKSSTIEIRNDMDLGLMYHAVSRGLGFTDEGGKMLGFSGYGQFDPDVPTIIGDKRIFNMGLLTFNKYGNQGSLDFARYPLINNEQKMKNVAFHVQKSLESLGLDFIQRMLTTSGKTNLILTGGVALNVVANNYYRKNLPENINMYVEPMCGDEGNCIGMVQYFIHERKGSTSSTPFPNIYLCGHAPSYNGYVPQEGETVYENVDEKMVAQLLIRKNIVAIFQGKAESGPRALGNRSILFDPRVPNGKDILNKVKSRESFRPFAATIMLEHVDDWFEMNGLTESPYMMYAVDAKEGVAEKVPSVVHVDNTCRIQTLTEEQNPNFYKLIKEFYNNTEIPMLFNTSFNLGGEPIVETLVDAVESCRRSYIEYLYLPEINKVIQFNKKFEVTRPIEQS
jgi:carbamoyltransferase